MKQIEAILPIVFLGTGECQDNEIKDKANGGACTACINKQVPNTAKDECVDCEANEIVTDGNSKCTACTGTTTPNEDQTECTTGGRKKLHYISFTCF